MRWEYGVLILFMIGVIVLSVYRPRIDMSILENISAPSAPLETASPSKTPTSAPLAPEGTALAI